MNYAEQRNSTSGVMDKDGSEQFDTRHQEFRTLHERGCFVIPNPWDVGSARYLQHLSFSALATTSAGFAFSRGLPDSDLAVSVERRCDCSCRSTTSTIFLLRIFGCAGM